MKRIAWLLILVSTMGWAQGACHRDVVQGGGQGIANVSVGVCLEGDTVKPCNTAAVSLYSNSALTTPLPGGNPTLTDANGNYGYCAATGTYNEQISGATIVGINNTPVTLIGQTGAFVDKGGAAFNILAYGAKCDGVTDDTTAINTAMAAAGLYSSFPVLTFNSISVPKRQGVVRFPSGKTCLISLTLTPPPGVEIDLNNSTLQQTANGQGGINMTFSTFPGYYFGGVHSGNIVGPGSGSSTGVGLLISSTWSHYYDLQIIGFKFGVETQNAEYDTFDHVTAMNNVVGWYLTIQAANKDTGASLDNSFTSIVADLNTKYGIWCQACSASQFDKVDASRNGVADIVLGSQLVKYISSIAVNAGGSGCTINARLPLTITDATGTLAQAYVKTNGAGVVTNAYVVAGGFGTDAGYTAPSFSGTGCGVAPTLTATITDDTGLGIWDGVSALNRGNLVFNNVKAEHIFGVDGPSSGYSVIINGTSTGAIRNVMFNNYNLQRETGGDSSYFKLAFNRGFGNTFNYPGDSGGVFDSMTNPALANDVSVFMNVNSQGLTTRWNAFSNTTNDCFKYTRWSDESIQYGGFGQHTQCFTDDGKIEAIGYRAVSSFGGATARENYQAGEANPRWSQDLNGTSKWGLGAGNALDTGLSRGAAAQLNVGNGTAGDVSGTIAAAGVKIGGGDSILWFKKATHATLDLASVASGACTAATSETITGAALGDSCKVSSGIATADSSFYSCNVTATDTVKWSYCNLSGGAIDRASDTYTIRVTR